jgi:hypothetical protein
MSKHANPPVVLALVALMAALLACTASFGEGDTTSSGGTGGGNNVPPGIAPTVFILNPPSGTRVPANQPVEITVETTSTTTNFLLNVDGRVASTKALPSDQSGPAQAILTWTPNRQGTVSLEVIAFNGGVASAPAALILDVSGTASGPTGVGVTACAGKALVSQLNFRDGPGTANTKLGQFAVGETMTIIGRSADSGWWQAQRLNGQQGWVINNAQWLEVSGACDAVPITG